MTKTGIGSSFVITLLLIWPIIVNSQPGTTFMYLGIDWKADNLDGTLFWTGIVLLIVVAVIQMLDDKLNKKEEKK